MTEEKLEFTKDILDVAYKSLKGLEQQLNEASAKDLVAIFNATIKAYRYLSTEPTPEGQSMDDLDDDARSGLKSVQTKSEQLIASLM